MCSCYGIIFSHLFRSGNAATAPASDVAWPVAYKKLQSVRTSQTSGRSDFHGAIVKPSGPLQSEHVDLQAPKLKIETS